MSQRFFRNFPAFFTFLLFIISKIEPTPLYAKENDKPFLIFDDWREGMFNVFDKALSAIDLYERGVYSGVKVEMSSKSTYHDPNYGPNWWEYYWEPINLGQPQPNSVIKGYEDDQVNIDKNRDILRLWPRQKIYNFIEKYIKLKPNLQKELDEILKKKFTTKTVIGIHFRGTDKVLEHYNKGNVRRIPYEEMAKIVTEQIKKNKFTKYKIFIATDEQQFLDYMIAHFPGLVIYQEAFRSVDGTPVHKRLFDGYALGKEALFDSLLLSHCSIIIRTKSALSRCSTWFNPNCIDINLKSEPLD